METKEEYLKQQAEKLKNFPAEKREKLLQNFGLEYDKKLQACEKERKRIEVIRTKMIPKKELTDGVLYIGPDDLARGMWFGVWDKEKGMFQCMRYKFGWQHFELPYFGDTKEGEAGLAPLKKVEKE